MNRGDANLFWNFIFLVGYVFCYLCRGVVIQCEDMNYSKAKNLSVS